MSSTEDGQSAPGNVYWLADRRRPTGADTSATSRYLPSRFVDGDGASGARVLEPVMSFDRLCERPSMWSDEIIWLSIAETCDDALPFAPAPGWPHDWFFDSMYGKKIESATVAQVSPTDILAADSIKRPLWYPGKKSRAGIHRVTSTGRHHSHDSMFERSTLVLLDWGGAEQILSQPGTLRYRLDGQTISHTPDFAANIDGVFTIVNCRPAARMNERLLNNCAALREVCLSRGWRSVLIVGYQLPAMTTLHTVGAKADAHDWLGYRSTILTMLADHAAAAGQTFTFEEVCEEFEFPMEARSMLQRLIWERLVAVDLNQVLTDDSLVRLSGTGAVA